MRQIKLCLVVLAAALGVIAWETPQAAAQYDYDPYVYYDYYDVGYDEDYEDDWFYDYYEYEPGITDDYDYYADYDYDADRFEWEEEGVFD